MLISEFMNPLKKNVPSRLTLDADSCLAELDRNAILRSSDEYINVIDASGQSVGSVRTDRLLYIMQKQQPAYYISILEKMDAAVIAIDTDSRIFFVNKAYKYILGICPGKILGRYLKVVEPQAALLDVLKTKKPESHENQLIRTINKHVSTSMYPIYVNGEFHGAFSIFTDNTRIHQMSEQTARISSVARHYSEQLEARDTLKKLDVIGENPAFLTCIERAQTAARTDATVLIRGENGTGKEVLTKIIRENSLRKGKPFITVNCSAIPEQLIESELFGYEAGSFTGGSKNGKPGKFQLADGGTIFLDEIGDMPFSMQAKLLRVLQNGEIEKIGRQQSIPVDVRVISATNQPLEDLIEKGRFRSDLYYRLNVISIRLPALRERGNDVILLANHFLKEFNRKYHKEAAFSPEIYQILTAYSWPGNVRELLNVVESSVILCTDNVIRKTDLPNTLLSASGDISGKLPASAAGSGPPQPETYGTLHDELLAYEKKILVDTLTRFDGNRALAMKELDIPKRTFYRKLALHNIK